MKTQQRFILCILLPSIIQVYSVATEHSQSMNKKLPPTNALTQCSWVDNDEDVVTSLHFTIHLNPTNCHSNSCGFIDKNGHVYHLKIINETSIPSTIFCLKQLKRLEIRNTCFSPCHHSKIPSDIQRLASSLTELGIYDTKITRLPDTIGKLVHLKTLKLSNTGLMSLPNTIGDLKSLTILSLPYNQLKSLPMTIINLRSLQELTLKNNPYLRSIQPINGLPALIILDARNCSIEYLPHNLPQLQGLYMTKNNLTSLIGIETLGSGTNSSKTFDFGTNHIRSIPSKIGQVKNLQNLHLNNNKLYYLPSDIRNISTLRHLSVGNNPINKKELKKLLRNLKLYK